MIDTNEADEGNRLMTWSDEEKKLRLSHKLEKQRIWLRIVLTFLVVLFTGGIAHWVGEGYASRLRQDELDHQSKLDLARERQAAYYARRFQAYLDVHSAYREVYDTFRRAAWHFRTHPADTSVDASFLTLMEPLDKLQSTIHESELFMSNRFKNEVAAHSVLYGALRHYTSASWASMSEFFEDLYYSITFLSHDELEEVLKGDEVPHVRQPDVALEKIIFHHPSIPEQRRWEANYLEDAYSKWRSNEDSVESLSDSTRMSRDDP
ncbi:MAG: hypothetical protein J7J98_03610 [candidate division Zixibacteria bacterium]|nr:hypothetical protein [candidate division Zixibacteria bacterium]